MVMKKAALLVAIAAIASATLSQAEARSRHAKPAAARTSSARPMLPPNVGGAFNYSQYSPAPGFGPNADNGRPGYNGPAYDSYNDAGPFGPHISRSLH